MRVLGEYWESIGRVLGEYWESIGRVLGEYWESVGRVLGEVHRQQTDDLRVWGEVHR